MSGCVGVWVRGRMSGWMGAEEARMNGCRRNRSMGKRERDRVNRTAIGGINIEDQPTDKREDKPTGKAGY